MLPLRRRRNVSRHEVHAVTRPRKRFTTAQRFELLKRENHTCHICEGEITPGEPPFLHLLKTLRFFRTR